MQNRILAAVFAALSLLTGPALAQVPGFPQTLPANTVIGRLGIGAGPSQAIPFTTLGPLLNAGRSLNIKLDVSPPAKCDVRALGTSSFTVNTAALTSAGAAFTSADIGKRIRVVPAQTVTITVASPGVVTWNNHGLANGARVQLTTTGALPTGLSRLNSINGPQIYFVVAATTNTFQVALTSGGTAINTSGTQSGVHTAYSYNTVDTTITQVLGATSIVTAATFASTSSAAFGYYGTDDATPIQQAVTRAASTASAVSSVYIPGNSPCLIASTIIVPSGMTISGDGKFVSQLLLGTSTMDGIKITGGDNTATVDPASIVQTRNTVTLRDFGIYSVGISTAGAGVLIDTGTNNLGNFHSTVSDMNFTYLFNGVDINRGSYATVRDSTFTNVSRYGVVQRSTHHPDYDATKIGPNNQFLTWLTPDSSQAHVEITGGGSTQVYRSRFIGGAVGVELNLGVVATGELKVENNTFEVIGQAVPTTVPVACIRLAVPAGASFGRVHVLGNELSCLQVAGGATSYDVQQQGTGTITDVIIGGGNIFTAGGAGTKVSVLLDYVSRFKLASDNIFVNLDGVPTYTGVQVGANSTNVVYGNAAFFGTFANTIVNNVPAGSFKYEPIEVGKAVGDANYTILPTDRYIYTNTVFTAARTWTLPAAASLNAGICLRIVDAKATVTSSNTLSVIRAGTDTIDGGTGALILNAAAAGTEFCTDGVSNWGSTVRAVPQGGTGLAGGTSGGVPYFNSTTTMASSAALAANQIVLGGGAGAAPASLGSLGTTTTLLHGNAGGAPTFGAVVSADMNITTTSCTNQFVTAISAGGVGTCTTDTLAGAQHANQGTTTTVLHGNASGNPSWAAVSLTADVTGTLPAANGGTGLTGAAWTSASPAATCQTGTPTTITTTRRTQTIGKSTFIGVTVALTNIGTCTGVLTIPLSNTSAANTILTAANSSSATFVFAAAVAAGISVYTAGFAFPGTNGQEILISGVYENQ